MTVVSPSNSPPERRPCPFCSALAREGVEDRFPDESIYGAGHDVVSSPMPSLYDSRLRGMGDGDDDDDAPHYAQYPHDDAHLHYEQDGDYRARQDGGHSSSILDAREDEYYAQQDRGATPCPRLSLLFTRAVSVIAASLVLAGPTSARSKLLRAPCCRRASR